MRQTTGGNPLFLGGVVQILAAESKLEHQEQLTAADLKLPVNVRNAILQKLQVLSARSNSMLAVGSVMGIEFDLAMVQQVADSSDAVSDDGLDEAIRAGIIAAIPESQGRHRFNHSLIRTAIYQSLGSRERIELHRRVADTLELLYASDIESHAAELAHHYIEAISSGTAEKAIDYSIRAGNAAHILLAHEEAVAQWRAAISMMHADTRTDKRRRADTLASLGRASFLISSDRTESANFLLRAIETYQGLARENDDPSIRLATALARLELGIAFSWGGVANDIPRAIAHYRSAEAAMESEAHTVPRGYLYIGLALTAQQAMQVGEAVAAGGRALDIALHLSDESLSIRAMIECAYVLFHCGRLAEAFALAELAREKAERFDSVELSVRVAWTFGNFQNLLSDPSEARRCFMRELSQPRLAHAAAQREILERRLVKACVLSSDLAGARRHLPMDRRPDPFTALLHFYSGAWDDAARMLDQVIAQTRASGTGIWLTLATEYRSHLLRVEGRNADAERILRMSPALGATHPNVLFEIRARAELIVIYAESERPTLADPHMRRCREIVAKAEDWRGLHGVIERAEGSVAMANADVVSAVGHFAKAVEFFRQYSLPWDEAETLFSWGQALAASGDQLLANHRFDTAIEIYQRHGGGRNWIDRVLARRTEVVSASPANDSSTAAATFHKHGDYWSLSFDGTDFNLKDARGLHYLARLLQRPGEEVAAIDLASLTAGDDSITSQGRGNLGDAGEVLDAQARKQYKRRLEELRDEIDHCAEAHDLGASQRAKAEYEALISHPGPLRGSAVTRAGHRRIVSTHGWR